MSKPPSNKKLVREIIKDEDPLFCGEWVHMTPMESRRHQQQRRLQKLAEHHKKVVKRKQHHG